MALNWLEEVVSQLYKLRGYIVLENEDLQMPVTKVRRKRGHSDIDIIAIKDGELIHVECMTWWVGRQDEKTTFRKLRERFEEAPGKIFRKYKFLRKDKLKVNNILVVGGKAKKPQPDGPWGRIQEFCGKEIKLREINTIVEDLIRELRKEYPGPERVGSEKGIARFLMHLIHNDFLKRPSDI